jgi:hypothetical protein
VASDARVEGPRQGPAYPPLETAPSPVAGHRSEAGDPLERLAAVVDFELFREELERALRRSERRKGGRPMTQC